MSKKMWLMQFEISLLVGATLSFILSLVGNLLSRQFEVRGWLISALVGLVITVAVGMIVPMVRISMLVHKKFEKSPFVAHCIESLISDLIYTPVICYLMVLLAWFRSGRHFNFALNYFRSLSVTFVVGYVLIFFLVPLYKKLVFHLNHVDYMLGKPGGPGKEDAENGGKGSKGNSDLV